MMDILRCKGCINRCAEKYFCNLLDGNKKAIVYTDKIVSSSKRIQEDLQKSIKNTIIKYKEIAFGVDTPICTEYLNVLLKQQVINEKAYREKLSE